MLCKLLDGLPTRRCFFESAGAIALLHEDWAVKGHAIVVARRHVENLSDLEQRELQQFMQAFQSVENALLSLLGKERSVVTKLGVQVPHLHLHIYPVAATDDRAAVMAAIDGRVRHEPAEGEAEELIERLRRALAPR